MVHLTVGQWRPNAAALCRAVAAERGRAMSGGGGRTRPRHVGRWRPNAAALCRAVAAERGRAMSGGGGRTRPHHVGRWRPRSAAPCRVALMGHGRLVTQRPLSPRLATGQSSGDLPLPLVLFLPSLWWALFGVVVKGI